MNTSSVEKTAVVRRGSEYKLRAVDWLWLPFLAFGEVTVFAGLPDQGKGTAVASILAHLTSNRPFPGEFATVDERDEALLLTAEESLETTTMPKVEADGGNRSKIHVLEGVMLARKDAPAIEREVSLAHDIDLMKNILKSNPKIAIVVIDPVDCYFGDSDKNSRQDVTNIYGQLRRLAEEYCVAVILVDHLNKNEGQAAIHRISGAGAAGQRPRISWLFGKDPEHTDICHIAIIKGNLLPDEQKKSRKFQFVTKSILINGQPTNQGCACWLGSSNWVVDDILVRPTGRRPHELDSAVEFLRAQLASGAKLCRDVYTAAEQAGISSDPNGTLTRARRKLGVESFRRSNPGPWWWKLPETVTDGQEGATDAF